MTDNTAVEGVLKGGHRAMVDRDLLGSLGRWDLGTDVNTTAAVR